jgi:hypothetical protein
MEVRVADLQIASAPLLRTRIAAKTFEVGNLSEARFAAHLLSLGRVVLMPFGGGCRYDMAIELDGAIKRIQVKTGRLISSGAVLAFNTCSNNKGYKRRAYHEDADYLGVYSPQLDRCYLVPVSETGVSEMKLRLEPPKNGQTKNVKLASDYQI